MTTGYKHSEETLKKMSGKNHWNYGNRSAVIYTSTCKNCGNSFMYRSNNDHYTNGDNKRTFCSRECRYAYDGDSRKVIPCSYCGEEVVKIKSFDKPNAFCNKVCYHLWQVGNSDIHPKGKDAFWFGIRGEETPNWQGGKSHEIYPVEFDNLLKKRIRIRDHFTCQYCGVHQRELSEVLHSHHIDYNKENNEDDNLISLCRVCHVTTNGNRVFWMNYFQTVMQIRNQKGATTIPQGSTIQAYGIGSAGRLLRRRKACDIVCSA